MEYSTPPNQDKPQLEERTGLKWPPRIIFNTDGCLVLKYLKRRNPDDVTDFMVPLAETGVDVVSVLIGVNDDLSWRGSSYGELWGENMGDDIRNIIPHGDSERTSVVGMNVASSELLQMSLAAMVDDGYDVMQNSIDRARSVGIGIYASIRMNDGHCNMEHRLADARRSKMKVNRHDLLIGSPGTVMDNRDSVWKFCWQWDYGEPEVRERFLGLIDETLERYGVDGIELDFSRKPPFFKPGQAYKHATNLTEFMRKALDIVSGHSKVKGADIKIACRVPTSIDACMELGIDLETWIRESLVHIAVISSPGGWQLENDVSRAVSAAKESGVLIYTGSAIVGKVSPQDGYEFNPPSVMRAITLNSYNQGATGVHLFNHDYSLHRPYPVSEGDQSDMPLIPYPPVYQGLGGGSGDVRGSSGNFDSDRFTRKELQTLRDLADPEALKNLNRCYYLNGDKSSGDYNPQVPRTIALVGRGAGQGHSMHINIEDDIAGGLANGRIKKTELRLRMTEYETSMNRIRCEVNQDRMDLHSARKITNSSGEEWLVLDNPPIHQGDNTILVLLEGYRPPKGWTLKGSNVGNGWPEVNQCEFRVICESI